MADPAPARGGSDHRLLSGKRLAFGCVGGAVALFGGGGGGGDVGGSDGHGNNHRWRFESCDYGRAVPGLISVASELDGYTTAETRRRTNAIGDALRAVFAESDRDGLTTQAAAERYAERQAAASLLGASAAVQASA